MKTKRRTGYGVFDISRQVARRIQKEWELVESPPRPPMRLTAEAIPMSPPDDRPGTEKRQLAA
jgi:hypothetical protein